MEKKAKVLAYYLPQFHPLAENDEWWGKGFTEWTNVGRAKSLFKGHCQPNVPTELGYYDLRLAETRKQQAELAKSHGIDAFCYWHYWFGKGKRLLEMPLNEVIRLKEPDFPFCLAWANHSWLKKDWNVTDSGSNKHKLLIEQEYPGTEDYDDHFYAMLDAFKDSRYYKIQDKLVFVIFDSIVHPDLNGFIARWKELAQINDLPGFYFIGQAYTPERVAMMKLLDLDAINFSYHHRLDKPQGIMQTIANYLRVNFSRRPNVIDYAAVVDAMDHDLMKEQKVYPSLVPNWDHTPRSGQYGRVFQDSTPDKFARHVDIVLDSISHKPDDDKIVFLKSWNEWGEGNYMEPDLQYGRQRLQILDNKLHSKK